MSACVMTVVCELEHLLVHTMDAPTPVSVNIPGAHGWGREPCSKEFFQELFQQQWSRRRHAEKI
eukprot:5249808-Amphidinium_carterae.1